jgi:lysophospholipase L1-like esterase
MRAVAGWVLVALGTALWIAVPVVLSLSIDGGLKATLVGALLVIAEVAFWAGAVLLGIGLIARLKAAYARRRGRRDEAATGPTTIVALGDSTTAVDDWSGRNVATYPELLPEALAAHGIAARIVNAGIHGTTTREARERLDRDVRAHAPDLVVVQFGINDSWIDADLGSSEPRLSRDEFRGDLRHIVRTLRRDGAFVVLMTPNPMRWADPYYLEVFATRPGLLDTDDERGINAWLDLYAEDVRAVAREEAAALVDVHSAFEDHEDVPGRSIRDLLMEDGIHPNDAGQRLVCALLTDAIAGILDPSGRT